jgi:hypothetical protein
MTDTVLLPKFDTYTSKPFGVIDAVSGDDPTPIVWPTEYVAACAETPGTRASKANIHPITRTRLTTDAPPSLRFWGDDNIQPCGRADCSSLIETSKCD